MLETTLTRLADHLSSVDGAVTPALRERSAIARLAAVPLTRTHRAPNYASDLGLRWSDDPGQYLVDAARLVGVDAIEARSAFRPDSVSRAWIAGELSDADLAGHLDCMINFAGLWDDAGALAQLIVDSDKLPATLRSLTYLGTALAAIRDDRTERVFAHLTAATWVTDAESCMSTVRRAAWLTKRRGQHEQAAAILRAERRRLDRAVQQRRLAPADRSALAGVTFNLEALTSVHRGAEVEAARLLLEAEAHLDEGDVVMVDDDHRRRYLAQVRVNRAQLTAQDEHRLQVASLKLDEHLAWTRAHHNESISEAMALAGYLHYRCGRWSDAAALLTEAEAIIIDEGAPSRLTSVRRNLVAAHARAGDDAAAQAVLERLSMDPSGVLRLSA